MYTNEVNVLCIHILKNSLFNEPARSESKKILAQIWPDSALVKSRTKFNIPLRACSGRCYCYGD